MFKTINEFARVVVFTVLYGAFYGLITAAEYRNHRRAVRHNK